MIELDDVVWELHVKFVELCANDEITHEEHNAFEDILDAVWNRRDGDRRAKS